MSHIIQKANGSELPPIQKKDKNRDMASFHLTEQKQQTGIEPLGVNVMDILCSCGHEMDIGNFVNNFFDLCDRILCGVCGEEHLPLHADAVVYMAMPYSVGNADPVVRACRYNFSCDLAAKLLETGFYVFSPITHSHPISQCMNNSKHHDFWLKQDEVYMDMCETVFIYSGLDEIWRNSDGIDYEIDYMRKSNKPIRLFTEEDFERYEILMTM